MVENISQKKLAELRSNVKAITFDLWGTLLDDSVPNDPDSDNRTRRKTYLAEKLKSAGYEFSDEKIAEAIKRGYEHFQNVWSQQIAFTARAGLEEMLAYLKADISEELLHEMTIYYEEGISGSNVTLFKGADDVIRRLHKKMKIGLISDTGWTPGRMLAKGLERNSVLPYFKSTIFSDEIGHTKPHPLLFQTAMKQLEVLPENTLHIGDLKFTDVRGANQIGCYSAWIKRPEFLSNKEAKDEPTVTVSSVHDLLEIFEV